jgi:hypothetical protein
VGALDLGDTSKMNSLEYVKHVLKVWFTQRVAPPFADLFSEIRDTAGPLIGIVGLGMLWSLAFVIYATRLANTFIPAEIPPTHATRAGWTPEDERESSFVRRFNSLSVAVAIALMVLLALHGRSLNESDAFLAAFLVPLAFALGGLFISFALTHVLQSSFARRSWKPGAGSKESRFRRSLYASLRGACIYGAVAAVIVPVVLIVLFALAVFPFKFFWSLAALAWAWFASRKGGSAATFQLGGWLQRPLTNIALVLFVAFGFAQISEWLLTWYRTMDPNEIWFYSLVVGLSCAALFLLLGLFVDANRISPHYFYRDRLTEAYLKTDARTVRPRPNRQGMPLTVLRDCEDLRLSALSCATAKIFGCQSWARTTVAGPTI